MGDIDAHSSFEQFRDAVLSNPLEVERDKVEFHVASDGTRIEFFHYDVHNVDGFILPRVGKEPVNLRPAWTYRSPYLKGQFGSDRITVTVGPIEQVYDFAESTVGPHEQ